MKRRVVVTRLGALTPIGNNVEDSWQGILNHQCGIDLIQSFDTSNMKVKVAGELKNFEATEYLDKKDAFKPSDFRLRKDNEKYEVQLLSGLHPENKGQRSG